MQLIVFILAVLVEVWFSIFRVQLQEEQRSREAGKHTHACPPAPPLDSSPHCSQTFPGLTVWRDHDPRWKRLPQAKAFRSSSPVTLPDNNVSSCHT